MPDDGCVVSVIIVTYNSRAHIRECLASLGEHARDVTCEVIVVDNGSTDGTEALVGDGLPGVVLLRSGANLGFAAACNRGVRSASGKYLLFLNPDTRLINDAVGHLVRFLEGEAAAGRKAICGASLVDDHGLPTKSWGAFPRLRTQVRRSVARTAVLSASAVLRRTRRSAMLSARPTRAAAAQVPFASGAALLVPRALFESYGGFDERFFMYAEEADLQFRAARDGVRRFVVREAVIYHAEGASFSVPLNRWKMLELSYRRFLEKHTPAPARLLGGALLSLVRMLEAVAEHMQRGDGRTLASKVIVLCQHSMRTKFGTGPGRYLAIARGRR